MTINISCKASIGEMGFGVDLVVIVAVVVIVVVVVTVVA